MIRNTLQPCLLDGLCGSQTQIVIEPESHPGLQVFGGAVFALRREPGNFEIDFVGAEQGGAATTAKADHYASLGQFSHCGLGDGGAGAKQEGCCVGDRDVPVERLLPFVGDIFDAAAVDQDSAVLEVVEICALRVENGLEIGWGKAIHLLCLPFSCARDDHPCCTEARHLNRCDVP